jgi:hypothetical protein
MSSISPVLVTRRDAVKDLFLSITSIVNDESLTEQEAAKALLSTLPKLRSFVNLSADQLDQPFPTPKKYTKKRRLADDDYEVVAPKVLLPILTVPGEAVQGEAVAPGNA